MPCFHARERALARIPNFLILLPAILLAAGIAAEETLGADGGPVLGTPWTGMQNVIEGSRDACWSEPPDPEGLIGSSEQILDYGLESELANDFVPPGDVISHATWWGGYYGNSNPCVPGVPTPGFNLRFYEDAGCVPGTVIADISVTTFNEESMGCQGGYYPLFKWDTDVNVPLVAGNLYWFGAQLKDHPFPPQGGRLAAGVVTGCESMFKSAFFSYPDWTRTTDVWDRALDMSQEFVCGAPSRALPTTWGAVKGLYR